MSVLRAMLHRMSSSSIPAAVNVAFRGVLPEERRAPMRSGTGRRRVPSPASTGGRWQPVHREQQRDRAAGFGM